MTEKQANISIAIPFYNEESILKDHLPKLIHELNKINKPIEVFLCDSGSNDKSLKMVESFIRTKIHGLHTWKFLYSTQRLSCGESCSRVGPIFTGKWLLILPADCQIDSEHLSALLNLPANEAWGGFQKEYSPNSLFLKGLAYLLNNFRTKYLRHLVWTNGLFISQSLYKQYPIPAKGFMEDVIWSDRLRRSEKPFYFLKPKIKVSSRRYQENGYFKVALLNLIIIVLYRFKILSIARLKLLYHCLKT